MVDFVNFAVIGICENLRSPREKKYVGKRGKVIGSSPEEFWYLDIW